MSITMDTLTAARLVAGHVDMLWSAWVNDNEGCCIECCAPCAALMALYESGQLDTLYGAHLAAVGGQNAAWDAEKQQVGREWLFQAWNADRGCADQHTTESAR